MRSGAWQIHDNGQCVGGVFEMLSSVVLPRQRQNDQSSAKALFITVYLHLAEFMNGFMEEVYKYFSM